MVNISLMFDKICLSLVLSHILNIFRHPDIRSKSMDVTLQEISTWAQVKPHSLTDWILTSWPSPSSTSRQLRTRLTRVTPVLCACRARETGGSYQTPVWLAANQRPGRSCRRDFDQWEAGKLLMIRSDLRSEKSNIMLEIWNITICHVILDALKLMIIVESVDVCSSPKISNISSFVFFIFPKHFNQSTWDLACQ